MSAPKIKVFVSNFKKNYQDIYYGREIIMIKSIKKLPGTEKGIRITLASLIDTFSHFLCFTVSRSYDGWVPFADYHLSGSEEFQRLPRNNAIVADRFIDNTQMQEKIFLLKPVFTDGRKSEIQTVFVRYLSSEFYKSRSMEGYPDIIVVNSGPRLNIGMGSVDDWVISRPTEEEKTFALQKWGGLIKDAETNYDKAKILAKTLMHDLWPHSGFPSDEMKVPPFEQYERMISGKDKGHCSNFTTIFVHACNALEIPARHIALSEIYSAGNASGKCGEMNLQIQGGSSHGVPEIFDERLNQWIWLDLRFYALGAWLGNIGPLTLAEFCLFINQEQRRKELKLLIYDMDNSNEKLLPLDKCPKQAFDCFSGWNTTLSYSKSAKQ
ncbi:MAG: transglutaminase domain-containing protein [Victivallaceae bacterium]|nr:transglutaminase domain-containing protein [Victivallaceae bacterium]